MTDSFYKLKKNAQELVESGVLTLEEFGCLSCLALSVNPANGYCLANFSMLAAKWNAKPARIKYVFEKLKTLGLIYYEMRQGKKDKSLFFVMGLEMTRIDGQTRIVTTEYIEKATHFSEVKTPFQKSENSKCIEGQQAISGHDSEVAYIEKEIEKEMYKHPLFKKILKENWTHLKAKYESTWLESRLEDYAGRLKGAISLDHLSSFLAEDWQKCKPGKDYRLENERERKKREVWEAEQRADEGNPPPPELTEWRKKYGRGRESGESGEIETPEQPSANDFSGFERQE